MSILNSIQDAERKAEEMKLKAMEDVNLLLENNKKIITEKVTALYDASSDKRRQIDANTEIVIGNKQKEIDRANYEFIDSLQKKASTNIEAVVDDIMKKVLQL